MVSFKLCISDPSTGRTFQKEVKDNLATPFLGLNIGETIKGDAFELTGYEFLITGGSDYCGFPMRKGILGLRKSLIIYGGVGFRGDAKGIKRRKTVCGHKIHERISQINLKVIKHSSKKLAEIFGVAEGQETQSVSGPQKSEGFFRESKKEEKKEAREKAEEPKSEHKKETKAEEVKEHKTEEKKAREHNEEKKE